MTAKKKTPGDIFAEQLLEGLRSFARVPADGARNLAVLSGVTAKGIFLSPPENLVLDAVARLGETRHVFTLGDKIVQEVNVRDSPCLAPLATREEVEGSASAILGNLIVAGTEDSWYLLPRSFVQLLLLSDQTWRRLPVIDFYFRRPVFDMQWVLRGPGWHPDEQLLVHGPDVAPATLEQPDGRRGLEGCPHLWRLLRQFPFKAQSDLTNYVGTLLTGILVNHFIRQGKPLFLFLANNSSLGKTFLARLVGILLDGSEPPMLRFTKDDELEKRLSAKIRSNLHTVLLIDNAKGELSSETLESSTTAPEVSFRELGFSKDIKCKNYFIWIVTSNNPRLVMDTASRMVPVELYFEGDAGARQFDLADPLGYAIEHQAEILAELYGLIVIWLQRGRPEGRSRGRFHPWDQCVGGILASNGFDGFLDNSQSVIAAADASLDEFARVAESVLDCPDGPFAAAGNSEALVDRSRPARDWARYYTRGENRFGGAPSCSRRGMSAVVGRFLSRFVDRPIDVITINGEVTVHLRVVPGRSNERKYVLEVQDRGGERDQRPVPGEDSTRRNRESQTAEDGISPMRCGSDSAAGPTVPSEGNEEVW